MKIITTLIITTIMITKDYRGLWKLVRRDRFCALLRGEGKALKEEL